jgi:SAM-dependent methyltransferase
LRSPEIAGGQAPDVAEIAERFAALGPWSTRFEIQGSTFGGELDYSRDRRTPRFFDWLGAPRTILELSSFEGAQTLQLGQPETTERVLGLEGRAENLARSQLVAELLGRGNLEFAHEDLETVDLARYGHFDAVFCGGLLYHLVAPWRLVNEVARVSPRFFLDTHYWTGEEVEVDGHQGGWYEEGGYTDPLSGLSRRSFWLTLPALLEILTAAGWAIQRFAHFAEWDNGPRVWFGCIRRGNDAGA